MSSIDLSVYFVRLFSLVAAIRAAYAAIEKAENVRDGLRRGLKVMVDAAEVYAAAKAAYDTIPALRDEVRQGAAFLEENCSYLADTVEAREASRFDPMKNGQRARLGKLWAASRSVAADIKYREAGEIIKTLN